MTEMIERVARAIANDPTGDQWKLWQTAARDAIKAMREPTDRMIESSYTATQLDDQWHIEDDQHFAKAFNAAIDAALGINNSPPYDYTDQGSRPKYANDD